MADRILRIRILLILLVVGAIVHPDPIEAQRKVLGVTFEGNEVFTSSQLKSVVRVENRSGRGVLPSKPVFNYLVMARDVTYLRAFYRNRGYLQCIVEERTESVGKNELIVHFMIHEGPLTVLRHLDFVGNELISDDQLRTTLERIEGAGLNDGDPISEAVIQAGAGEILARYQEGGHYFAGIIPRIGRRDSISGSAPVIYQVQEGPVVRVSRVRIEGMRITKDFVITREVILNPGDLITEEDRRESQRRLYATGIFKAVTVSVGEVSPDSTSAVILVTVSERPKRYVGAGVGLAGDEEEQVNLRLRTSTQWGHRNVLGTGRAVELSGRFDFRLVTAWEPVQSELGIRYVEPWFLNNRTPLSFYCGLRPQSYESHSVREFAAEIGLSKEISLRSRGWINFTFRRVITEEKILLEDFTSRDNLRGFNAMVMWDKRDNILSPSSGSFLRIGLSGYGVFGLGGPQYGAATFNWSRYQRTGSRSILASRIRLGFAHPGNNVDETPIIDRFFAGGASSVRGYEERKLGPVYTSADSTGEPRGGQALALINLELRRPSHFGPLGLVLFLDAGNVWETVAEMRENPKLAFSTGLGLFLDTPIGPIQVGYGWRLNISLTEDKYEDYKLGSGQLYITIQHAF